MEQHTRRSAIASIFATAVALWPKRGIVLDYSNMGRLEAEFIGGKILVDGVEIESCWYIDQRAGFVRTYDIHGEGKAHKYELDETRREVKWREIRGTVTLLTPLEAWKHDTCRN